MIKVKKTISDYHTQYYLEKDNIVIGEEAFKHYVEFVGAENIEMTIVDNKNRLKDNPNLRKIWENNNT